MTQLKEYKHVVPITGDTEFTGCIPPGYMLESIVFVESAGNVPTLDLGLTSNAHNVFDQQAMVASDITTVVINKVFSMLSRQTLYLSDAGAGTWNGASLTALLNLKRAMI